MTPSTKKWNLLRQQKQQHWVALGLFCLVAILLRFPFFFRDYIDKDESTFILMGQSWAEGCLPYLCLWDLKPPITFLFFAGCIKIFGKSILMIRLMGSLVVGITGYFSYKWALELVTAKKALGVGILTIYLLSLFGSVQGVMSEHLCVALFLIGAYLISKKEGARHLVGGLLIGAAFMTKQNIGFPALFIGLYLLWETHKARWSAPKVTALIQFGLGILLSIFLTALPFILSSQHEIFWDAVLLAPMAYSGSGSLKMIVSLSMLLVLGFSLRRFYKNLPAEVYAKIAFISLALLGILFSFLQQQKINGHYLLLIYPFLLLWIAWLIEHFKLSEKIRIPNGLLLFFLFAFPVETYLEWSNVLKNKREKGSFYNGEGIDIPQYLKTHHLDEGPILFLEYHIGYWFLDAQPPSKAATHPSNITREFLYPFFDTNRNASIEEIHYLFEQVKPKIVVTRKGKIFDRDHTEINAATQQYLDQDYRIETEIGRGAVYRRFSDQ